MAISLGILTQHVQTNPYHYQNGLDNIINDILSSLSISLLMDLDITDALFFFIKRQVVTDKVLGAQIGNAMSQNILEA